MLATQHRDPAILHAQRFPPDAVRINLTRLCNDLLEVVRLELGPMRPTSGYRCPALNTAVGGSGTRPGQKPSAHMAGRACDFHPMRMPEVEAMERIADRMPWALDKAILEVLGDGCWIHAQIAKPGEQPKRLLLMTFDGVNYPPFDPSDPRVANLREAP